MSIGNIIHYIDSVGRVHKVARQTETRNGLLDVRFADGRIQTVRELDVTNSQGAANVISSNRRVTANAGRKVEFPTILRDPK